MKQNTRYILGILFLGFIGLLVIHGPVYAGKWSVNAGMQWLNGEYTYVTRTSTFYFSGGLSYRAERWNVAVNVPLIAQNTTGVTNMGGLFLPNGEGRDHGGFSHWNTRQHGYMPGAQLPTTQMRFGLGDIYVYGEYRLLGRLTGLATVSLTGTLKLPTASQENNYGTGEFDYGLGGSVRKFMHSYSFFLDLGYLVIGDPVGISYNDPLTFGAGVGRFFFQGRYSVLLYYQQYSRILADYDPPRQANLAGFVKVSTHTILSVSLLMGFSETSPDYGLLTTIEYTF